MSYLLPPVLIAQLSSIALVLPAFYLGNKQSKREMFLLILFFVVATVIYFFTLGNPILNLNETYSIVNIWLTSIRTIEPSLITNIDVFLSWFSLVIAAISTWFLVLYMTFYDTGKSLLRGTKIKSEEEMKKQLKKHGKAKVPIKIGNYSIPQKLETRPIGLFGEPGSGKTQILLWLLNVLNLRQERALFVDINGEVFKKLGEEGDLILSVTHDGSVGFSPLAEIQCPTDCEMIANAFIPEGVGENKAWNGYARTMLTVFLRCCNEHDRTKNSHLIYFIKRAPIEELERLCRGSSVQRLFEKGSEKMLSNVMSILSQHLTCLELLNPSADKDSFSLRKWIQSEKLTNQKLWIIYDEFSAAATQPLRSAWLEIFIRESLNLAPDSNRRLWGIFDELATNRKLESLGQAISRGRKYGFIPVIAVQNVSQLYSIYGRDEANTILGSIGHSVILRTPDPDTSDYLSRAIGEKEITRKQVASRDSKNANSQIIQETKRAVLPSEISSLPDLNGYIKFAGVGWAKVKIPLLKLKNKNALSPKNNDNSLLDRIEENKLSTTSNLSFDDV